MHNQVSNQQGYFLASSLRWKCCSGKAAVAVTHSRLLYTCCHISAAATWAAQLTQHNFQASRLFKYT